MTDITTTIPTSEVSGKMNQEQFRQAMERADLAEKVDETIAKMKKDSFNLVILAAAKLNPEGVHAGTVHDVYKELDGWLDALRRSICGDRVSKDGAVTRVHLRPKE